MNDPSSAGIRCGIILAAGEGKRLQPLIRQWRGDLLPKQYVNFIGTRSMLEHTFHRVEKLIPPERIFTVVGQNHLSYPGVRRQLSGRPGGTVIAQPQNRETGPGVLLPLMHLYKRFPDSTVALFPSDHFFVEEDLFMDHVALACRAVERDPSLLVLLGIEPYEAEPEYGYVLSEGKPAPSGVRGVRLFVEKPHPESARELIGQGALWNTMVLVCRTETLLELMRGVAGKLYRSFQRILRAIGTPGEREVVDEVYSDLEPMNLSREFLAALPLRRPRCLYVLPVGGVFWSDLGLPRCVETALKKTASWRTSTVRTEPQKNASVRSS